MRHLIMSQHLTHSLSCSKPTSQLLLLSPLLSLVITFWILGIILLQPRTTQQTKNRMCNKVALASPALMITNFRIKRLCNRFCTKVLKEGKQLQLDSQLKEREEWERCIRTWIILLLSNTIVTYSTDHVKTQLKFSPCRPTLMTLCLTTLLPCAVIQRKTLSKLLWRMLKLGRGAKRS